jgi:arylsulfatase A-like enzyme
MKINRRDFLKLTGILSASTLLPSGIKLPPSKLPADPNSRNVLIILFDALSATNVNFYGYPRETMPHLTQLLERGTVYHNHYAGANFTTPGTASLLTGRYPWEHLALKLTETVVPNLADKSIFSFFDDYFTLACTHNRYVEYVLEPFSEYISTKPPRHELFLEYSLIRSSHWFTELLSNDPDLASLFKSRLADTTLDGYIYSLLFPSLLREDKVQLPPEILKLFPRGVPDAPEPFLLEDAIDWTLGQTRKMKQPFLGYLHYLPPHSPYHTRKEFIDAFKGDSYIPPEKPRHPVIIQNEFKQPTIEQNFRRQYDEFLLYVDSEFNRLFTQLDQQGILDNTLLVLTSDHGEMFERRTVEHNYPYLYDPVVKVPLIIFEPGQTERIDIHTPTSCLDLLPTLLHRTGHEIPSGLPGEILPPYLNTPGEPHRSIYAMDARWNTENTHIQIATLMMRKGELKAIRYSNYANYYLDQGHKNKINAMHTDADPFFEVFDLENDPEEMNNLASNPTSEIQALIDELEQLYREKVEYPG